MAGPGYNHRVSVQDSRSVSIQCSYGNNLNDNQTLSINERQSNSQYQRTTIKLSISTNDNQTLSINERQFKMNSCWYNVMVSLQTNISFTLKEGLTFAFTLVFDYSINVIIIFRFQ